MKTPQLSLLVRLCGALFLSSACLACSGVAATSNNTAAPADPAPGAAAAPVAAPAPVTAAAPVAVPAAGDAGLLQQIQAAIGTAACDSPAQCKTVAIGHKACGGPESYMAYSTKGNSAQVTSLAAKYAAARQAGNKKSGMISNCMLLSDPGATCSAGRCVTTEPGQGAVAR